MAFRHLFGPVPSRRLGMSLGIDMVPLKTCSLNCVYCECGATTALTLTRDEYRPTDEILAELDDYLKSDPALDYITFAGSGEPTLHRGIGRVIDFLKTGYPRYKIAVLTNGTLLDDREVRGKIGKADLVMPSLDAVSEEIFRAMNRPCEGLSPALMIEGLTAFREEFTGALWLEIFIIPGLNDGEPELWKLKQAISRIKPDRVQINSLDRPGAESWVLPADKTVMERIAAFLDGEIIAGFSSQHRIESFNSDMEAHIVSTLKRRPCTAGDLSAMLGLRLNEVNKYLKLLLESGKISGEKGNRGIFFRVR